jgi:hypothetical protein
LVVFDCDGEESLFADDADDGFVLAHVVLHFLLDESVVFEQVLQVLLAESEIFLQLAVLLEEITVYVLDFVALGEG